MTADSLLFLGGGHPEHRWWELEQFRSQYRLKLITARPPTWEHEYFSEIEFAQPRDGGTVAGAAERLAKDGTVRGVICYHEPAIEAAAHTATELGLPSLSARAARLCRDKHAARQAFDEFGVPSAQSVLVHSADEAAAAASRIGYPVIVKPRALAASFGVSKAYDEPRVRSAFAVADRQVLNEPWRDKPAGVLVEEYLEGPEISVDSLTVAGRVRPLIFASKQLGFPPYCEELGHIVGAAEDVCRGRVAEVVHAVRMAHAAFGVEFGATHTELRLTASGVRLIELNGRPGGACIGYLGYLAAGLNFPLGLATAASGHEPDAVTGEVDRAAGIRFCYASESGTITALHSPGKERLPAYVDRVEFTVRPGSRVALAEGRMYNARIGYVLVTGPTTAECADRLDAAMVGMGCDVAPLT